MKCKNCCYHYQTEDDRYPCCHYNDLVFPAPCEIEEQEVEEDD